MAKLESLCNEAKRFLVNGIPLRIRENKTRYFLYPLTKEDYNIIHDDINALKETLSKTATYNANIVISKFVSKWGFNPFKEGAFIGSTKIKTEDDFEIIKTLFETTTTKNPTNNVTSGSYPCFCCKKFKSAVYAPHPTIKSSWECMLIAYDNPPYAIVLSHKIDDNGNRLWED